MGDFFDIANLITKVGVEGIKIKPEPGLPEKSSNEILTELFSTFDADEGIVSPDNTDQQVPDAVVKVEKADKSSSKKKKSKKKHKHKEKKHKKKSKRNSSESNSESEGNNKSGGSKKKKKHKKKSKHKSEHNSGKSSDSDEPKAKKRKVEETTDENSKKSLVKEEPHSPGHRGKEFSPELPSVVKKVQEDFEGDQLPKLCTDKSKQTSQGKILIKDLKNSTVYNETVKAIEIKEKAKAARMEDGEISDSSSGNRTPTLSSLSDNGSPRSLSPPVERRKHRSKTSPKPGLGAKNDLRLILKEKEKKRLEGSEKIKGHIDADSKDIKVHNEHNHRKKTKTAKHKYGSHSPERKKSLSPTRTNSHRSRSRGKERYRDRSRNRRDRSRSHEKRESGWSRDRRRHRSHSESRSHEKYSRGRSRSKERKERIEIDKKKLLEIARRNAISMIKQGALPLAQQDKAIAAIQAGGKTVDELTDFCKSLSKSEALGELSSISSDEDESGSEKGFHHPFLLKERPSSIIMNIKDAKQLPTKTFQEKTAESCNQLRLQFPVSSGQQHRKTENEWVPVIPKKPEHAKPTVPTAAVVPAPTPPTIPTPVPAPVEIPSAIPQAAPIYSSHPVVFPQQPVVEPLDIGTIVSQRLSAMRKLRENPHDVVALNDMYRAQTEMRNWAESKQMPGQFTGSTGVKLLSPAELASGYQAWARKFSGTVSTRPSTYEVCWSGRDCDVGTDYFFRGGRFCACMDTGVSLFSRTRMPRLYSRHIATSEKKLPRQPDILFTMSSDQLVSAQPVSGGMGMALLQKMGWRPGEGLGKNKEGTLEPLQLEVKLDKRGLVSEQDIGQKIGKTAKPVVPAIKTLEGKHPVSLLGEYCSKRKIGAPVYELCFECGPDHRKNFLFKVRVNGVEYRPTVASPNKKQAKAEAAQICLQTIGLLPEPPPPAPPPAPISTPASLPT